MTDAAYITALLQTNKMYCLGQLAAFLILCISVGCTSDDCRKTDMFSGNISAYSDSDTKVCWIIKVPEQHYAVIYLTDFNYVQVNWRMTKQACDESYLQIKFENPSYVYKLCPSYSNPERIISLSDVEVSYYFSGKYSYQPSSFKLHYKVESLVCMLESSFRCSNYSCINQNQACDGVEDCEDGSDEIGCDEISSMEGVVESQKKAIDWLRNSSWGKETPRAVIALYLSRKEGLHNECKFERDDLLIKRLELQTLIELMRNPSDPESVSELSMFINALSLTCHNIREFYGYDLVRVLSERMAAPKLLYPGAYLTLCNANWTYSESNVDSVMGLLHRIEYPFRLDIQAMILMTLTCIKRKSNSLRSLIHNSELYNSTIERMIDGQLPDGSFGNVYTTALVTQALLSSGMQRRKWKITATVKYLIQELDSSIDYLSAYLILPIFSGRSLVDIATVNCSKHREQEDVGMKSKLTEKTSIQYSLFIGDQKDVVHTMYLKMPENSSVYDIMAAAEMTDPKYKFLKRDVSGHMYVYEINGITNDPEAGKFWFIYTQNQTSYAAVHHTESPEKVILVNGEHLIMWYRTFRLVGEDETEVQMSNSREGDYNSSSVTEGSPASPTTSISTDSPASPTTSISTDSPASPTTYVYY